MLKIISFISFASICYCKGFFFPPLLRAGLGFWRLQSISVFTEDKSFGKFWISEKLSLSIHEYYDLILSWVKVWTILLLWNEHVLFSEMSVCNWFFFPLRLNFKGTFLRKLKPAGLFAWIRSLHWSLNWKIVTLKNWLSEWKKWSL